MSEQEKPMQKYEDRYKNLLLQFSKAAGELAAAGDIKGIHFLTECLDAVLGRALQYIEAQQGPDQSEWEAGWVMS
jgi:hypothetical protein